MLPIWITVDLGVMAMKRYSAFPKTPGLEPHHHPLMEGSYPSAGMQSVYSTAQADWADNGFYEKLDLFYEYRFYEKLD